MTTIKHCCDCGGIISSAIRQRTKAHIERPEQRNQELEDMVGLLKVRLAAKNAADNNNNNNNNDVSFGMPMDLGQNMSADTTNMKWAIDTDKNMIGMLSVFGNETSTGDIYNVGEEGGYEDSAFGPHITQHPWARLNVSSTTVASGNLYTTDLSNSFYSELWAVSQIPPPDTYLRRRNETHMLLFNTPSVQSMSDDKGSGPSDWDVLFVHGGGNMCASSCYFRFLFAPF